MMLMWYRPELDERRIQQKMMRLLAACTSITTILQVESEKVKQQAL
jgi:hypothetical protein